MQRRRSLRFLKPLAVNAVGMICLALPKAHAHGVEAEQNVAQPTVAVEMLDANATGMFEVGTKVTQSAKLTNTTSEPLTAAVVMQGHSVTQAIPKPKSTKLELGPNESATIEFEFALDKPGFMDVECIVHVDSIEEPFRARRRVGCEPTKISVPLTAQSDFDEFWREAINKLRDREWSAEVESHASESEDVNTFEVTLKSHGNVTVRGWLEVPQAEGPHPAVLRVPGYGSTMRPLGNVDDMIVFSFNPRGHGNSQDQVPREPVDYWIRGLDSKDDYYYLGAYLDCLQAIEYLSRREDVDQERIAVWGGSQGGGLAFATAALDSRVDLCISDITWLCDWVNYFELTDWPEMNSWVEDRESRGWKKTLTTLSYFDTMNLASRIQCPTVMSIGLQDPICPPTTSYATFNRIRGPREDWIYKESRHGLPASHYPRVWSWIRQKFDLAAEKR